MDSATYIYNESIKEFEKCSQNDCCLCYTTDLSPVKIICKIPVHAEIKFIKYVGEQEYKMILLIEACDIWQSYKDDDLEKHNMFTYSTESKIFNISVVKNFLIEIQSVIRSLEFNKLLGIFMIKGKVNPEYLCFDIFGDEFINSADCCVCLDKTSTFTDCNHPLCVECWSYLKSDDCPICRNHGIVIVDPTELTRSDCDSNSSSDSSHSEETSSNNSTEFDEDTDEDSDEEYDEIQKEESDSKLDNESDKEVNIDNILTC